MQLIAGSYHIEIDETIEPVQHAPRRVAVGLKKEFKEYLDSLVAQGIIKSVTHPTKWINSMVVVRKANKLRIRIDPKDLSKAIKQPHYPLPTLEDIFPKLAKAKIFSVLDANKGF